MNVATIKGSCASYFHIVESPKPKVQANHSRGPLNVRNALSHTNGEFNGTLQHYIDSTTIIKGVGLRKTTFYTLSSGRRHSCYRPWTLLKMHFL